MHIENVDKEYVAEAEDPDVEYLEEQQQFASEDQEQNQELTNFVDTQGKHRKHITMYLYITFKFMQTPVHFLKPSVTTLSLSLTITTIFMH